MIRNKNILAQREGFSYRNRTMLFLLICFIFSNLHCQIYVGENTRISVSGDAAIYTKDTVVIPSELSQKESPKVYVLQETIISGNLSNDIAYIGKPETKKKIRHKLLTATRKEKVEKIAERSSQSEKKKTTVSYGTANRRVLGICPFTSDVVIIFANNTYKAAAVALEEPNPNNTISHSKERITYTSFVRIVAACYTFYALRGPPSIPFNL